MPVKFSLTATQIARPVAALALMVAFGLPAHAGGGTCAPAPVQCSPAPVKCSPVPQCNPIPQCSPVPQCGPKAAVPEPGSVALVGIGAVALLPLGMRALKSRRRAA